MQENFSENYPTLTAFGMNKESALELIGMLTSNLSSQPSPIQFDDAEEKLVGAQEILEAPVR